ncbi:MAG: indolepyruvate oxidoreductase subunit beta [Clostridia bacterium]|uniref:Indolepyruvate ferredoxin oxidoreductase beta subunit n=1 Tax=Peptococcus niger TaxID=2741 RepID=A0A1G6TB87_PEPNI|nr:indolepyruvate oxidoreductase subunit beta [Peptococcus niger]MBS5595452.1 indolepyruvate oxidoreductase subunit beta [Clostridiales bacterium]MDU7505911.1 indolepyruvate oxidoreductase subunit beta [Clostridia bacterium]MDU1029383.1 indolepyruvate oxidoreductase subunit beta [Clostridiales bacterium]MDU7245672.1 indolepyruvate oxidoreductase subunit beta [Clostridiales bacterium]SDD25575.1 indolepyruvate ferredoxin oxidoreductase beta subunit [Peptococcus niger]
MSVTSVLLVGIGGQGTVFLSNILVKGLLNAGYDVKMSEIHGMAQRGGTVSTQVRYGDKVYSPIIGDGEADIMVAFEKQEALRYMHLLKPGGELIVNDEGLPSAPVQSGKITYPEDTIDVLKGLVADTVVIKASDIADELGNPKVANVVLFGALAKLMNLADIDWKPVIAASVKEKFVDVNMEAFDRGQALIQ